MKKNNTLVVWTQTGVAAFARVTVASPGAGKHIEVHGITASCKTQAFEFELDDDVDVYDNGFELAGKTVSIVYQIPKKWATNRGGIVQTTPVLAGICVAAIHYSIEDD